MGKNFSCNNLGQRKKSDFYETPYSLTEQFLQVFPWLSVKTVLEPAAGDGAITKIVERFALGSVEAYDPMTHEGYDFYHTLLVRNTTWLLQTLLFLWQNSLLKRQKLSQKDM